MCVCVCKKGLLTITGRYPAMLTSVPDISKVPFPCLPFFPRPRWRRRLHCHRHRHHRQPHSPCYSRRRSPPPKKAKAFHQCAFPRRPRSLALDLKLRPQRWRRQCRRSRFISTTSRRFPRSRPRHLPSERRRFQAPSSLPPPTAPPAADILVARIPTGSGSLLSTRGTGVSLKKALPPSLPPPPRAVPPAVSRVPRSSPAKNMEDVSSCAAVSSSLTEETSSFCVSSPRASNYRPAVLDVNATLAETSCRSAVGKVWGVAKGFISLFRGVEK